MHFCVCVFICVFAFVRVWSVFFIGWHGFINSLHTIVNFQSIASDWSVDDAGEICGVKFEGTRVKENAAELHSSLNRSLTLICFPPF